MAYTLKDTLFRNMVLLQMKDYCFIASKKQAS